MYKNRSFKNKSFHRFCVILCVGLFYISCKMTSPYNITNPDGNTIDRRLVGKWYGQEKLSTYRIKKWNVIRYPDGVYDVSFSFVERDSTISKEIITTQQENQERIYKKIENRGFWYVEKGKLYERAHGAKVPFVYRYNMVTPKEAKFDIIKDDGTLGYQFADYKED